MSSESSFLDPCERNRPAGDVGIRLAAMYFWATLLIRVGSMIPWLARAAFGWKKVLVCRKETTLGSGPVRVAFESEKSPLNSAGVKTVMGLVVVLATSRC